MTMTPTVLPIDRGTIQALAKHNSEPQWLTDLRSQSLELAARLELPQVEKTNIAAWNLDYYGQYKPSRMVSSAAELPESVRELISAESAENLLVQRNSAVIYRSLSKELAEQGVIFTDLQTAAREHPELVRAHLMQAVKNDENRLAALHAAVWSGGLFLYVPRHVQVNEPITAVFFTDDSEALFCPHVLIVCEDNSALTYVDSYLSAAADRPFVHNGIVEIFAKPGARVKYASVHNMGEAVTDISYRRAILENDAAIEWVVGEMNDGSCLSDTSSVLRGDGSSTDAKIICIGTGEQKTNITTRAAHFGKNTASAMVSRAVMKDRATAIINGITKIEKGASRSNGQQTEKILMLSPEARGDANPILLIDEDNVSAGHAASVGQVNKEQIYYLMSRGIPKHLAEKLIIYGFMAPVVAELPVENLSARLQMLIERKLER